VISHDRMFLDRLATHMLAFEGDSHVEWFEGNFEDYEKDKVRRLGAHAADPRRIKYKPLTRFPFRRRAVSAACGLRVSIAAGFVFKGPRPTDRRRLPPKQRGDAP
jgi:hypothetical protein